MQCLKNVLKMGCALIHSILGSLCHKQPLEATAFFFFLSMYEYFHKSSALLAFEFYFLFLFMFASHYESLFLNYHLSTKGRRQGSSHESRSQP